MLQVDKFQKKQHTKLSNQSGCSCFRYPKTSNETKDPHSLPLLHFHMLKSNSILSHLKIGKIVFLLVYIFLPFFLLFLLFLYFSLPFNFNSPTLPFTLNQEERIRNTVAMMITLRSNQSSRMGLCFLFSTLSLLLFSLLLATFGRQSKHLF